mmetsp:Transcript_21334/g.65572  ORF Transcript_21334/g.65572 Transcript_21334/m.65572 type:complete len:228 (+) Transcript_21334:206-889(+)
MVPHDRDELVDARGVLVRRDVEVEAERAEEDALHGVHSRDGQRPLARLDAAERDGEVDVPERRVVPVLLRHHRRAEQQPLAVSRRHAEVRMVGQETQDQHERDDAALGREHAEREEAEEEVVERDDVRHGLRVRHAGLGPERAELLRLLRARRRHHELHEHADADRHDRVDGLAGLGLARGRGRRGVVVDGGDVVEGGRGRLIVSRGRDDQQAFGRGRRRRRQRRSI